MVLSSKYSSKIKCYEDPRYLIIHLLSLVSPVDVLKFLKKYFMSCARPLPFRISNLFRDESVDDIAVCQI